MTDSIPWMKLVAQGRAKSYGVAWSDEELKALASGVSPEELRKPKSEVKVEEPKAEVPEVPAEPVAKPKAVKKPVKKVKK